MKKAVVLSLLLLVPLAFAGEQKCTLSVGKVSCNGCASKVKAALEKVDGVKSAEVTFNPGSATVLYADDKTNAEALIKAVGDAGYEASPAMIAEATPVAKGATPATGEVKSKEEEKSKQSETTAPPVAPIKQAAKIGKIEEVKAQAEVKEGEQSCSMKLQCKELNQFHAAMHPMAMAVGFEGDGGKDYPKVRSLYPNLKAKAELLGKMVCDETCVKDVKAFETKRAELLKSVEELGIACAGKDDSKIDPAFEKMHEGYIQLAMLAK